MSRGKVSAHFAAAEFDCNDGRQWPPAAREALEYWAKMLGEPLREHFGAVRVTSGYRPNTYNRRVGGAPLSYHRYELRYGPGATRKQEAGVAVDVACSKGDPSLWAQYMIQSAGYRALGRVGRGAVVAYPASGFVHMDTGPRRSWAG